MYVFGDSGAFSDFSGSISGNFSGLIFVLFFGDSESSVFGDFSWSIFFGDSEKSIFMCFFGDSGAFSHWRFKGREQF